MNSAEEIVTETMKNSPDLVTKEFLDSAEDAYVVHHLFMI